MSLRKLKKELKRKGPGAKKNRQRGIRLILAILVCCLLLIALAFGYRSYQETIPGRLYSKGLALESQGRPEQALSSYERLFGSYGESPMAPEALYRAARIARFDLRQDKKALLFFLQLEHDYPDSEFVAKAQQEAAELSKNRLRDYAQAIVIYQRLLDSGMQGGDRIQYEIADSYFRLNNYSQARIEFEALLERFPESPLCPEVLFRRANAAFLDGQNDAARAGYQELIDSYPGNPYSVEARFSMAEILETEEKLKEALKAYRTLKGYPQQVLLEEKIKHLEERIAKKKKVL